jgi:hypothetical protein
MPVKDSIIKAKANGFSAAIKSMSPEDRRAIPSEGFVADYNSLRKLFLDANPEPEMREATPPEVKVSYSEEGQRQSTASYPEILVYVEQIAAMTDAMQH